MSNSNNKESINIGDKLYMGAYGWITIKAIEEEVVKAEGNHDGSELVFKFLRKEEG